MGACFSSSAHDKERERSANIDRAIEEDAKRFKKECKILLLGSGESGKSTIVKQMKIIHQNGYSHAELLMFRPTIYRNLLESAEAAVLAMRKLDIQPAMEANRTNDVLSRIEVWCSRMRSEGWWGGERGARGALMWMDGELESEAAKVATIGASSPIPAPLAAHNPTNSADGVTLGSFFHASQVGYNGDVDGPLQLAQTSDSSGSSTNVSRSKSEKEKDAALSTYDPRNPDAGLPLEIAQAIHDLFEDPMFKYLVEERSGEFYMMDSGVYFMEHALRIASGPEYVPTTTDVLRARAKSVGIAETRFDMGPLSIHMFDVGGQRSERKKWIHCFEAVTSIIFCVALSEYDQGLIEAKTTNRLVESLVLFNSIVHSQWFVRTSIVLFLNKMDVFKKKIPKIPLSNHFSEYAGGPDVQKAAKFILWKFTQENRGKLSIYPHLTQATNTNKIKLVFAAVKETILSNSLKESGIL
ncbi:Guanine nucleotide-binding protein alpha-3 subunit [Serendipita indica DSM 11827]|uniref:Related to guanine nucleotide-binding protein alpha-3 subunit n=1 Tax=Serendipita indica (strain DSM 11827) TaxID=1109443 RepID=G4TY06_SERID|nr:Guanine nucleotide-binding protein alpha-3 subunit [Serendipita indica DSM 11827]CCA76199.1 related to guanine nucleotide-binding protein alpha-3 subunit [Serendipita indica DSM 11827]